MNALDRPISLALTVMKLPSRGDDSALTTTSKTASGAYAKGRNFMNLQIIRLTAQAAEIPRHFFKLLIILEKNMNVLFHSGESNLMPGARPAAQAILLPRILPSCSGALNDSFSTF